MLEWWWSYMLSFTVCTKAFVLSLGWFSILNPFLKQPCSQLPLLQSPKWSTASILTPLANLSSVLWLKCKLNHTNSCLPTTKFLLRAFRAKINTQSEGFISWLLPLLVWCTYWQIVMYCWYSLRHCLWKFGCLFYHFWVKHVFLIMSFKTLVWEMECVRLPLTRKKAQAWNLWK